MHISVQEQKGRRPSFEADPVGPSSKDIGGAATIPSTNVDVKSAAPESSSAFDEEHKSAAKVISPTGTAASMEEEDGSHHEDNKYVHAIRRSINRNHEGYEL